MVPPLVRGMNMLVEIYPNNKSDRKYDESHFAEIKSYGQCVEWFADGNELVVMLNTENGKEAVYERLGNVICLMDTFGLYEYVDIDDDNDNEPNLIVRRLLARQAIDCGFTERCPARGMTWRELADEILSHPEALDTEAIVWVHEEDFYMGGHEIVGVSPYYSRESVSENNKLSIDIR